MIMMMILIKNQKNNVKSNSFFHLKTMRCNEFDIKQKYLYGFQKESKM